MCSCGKPKVHRIAVKKGLAYLMKKGKKFAKDWKLVIQGLPLAGAAASTFLPLSRLGQQFSILIVLLWVQVFFIVELFLYGK
jgi:hypothetical protein